MHAGAKWWLGAAMLIAVAGCAKAPYVWVYDLPPTVATGAAATVAPGDRLFVFVRDQPTLSAEVVVAEDRTIALPVVGQVAVANRNVDAVAQAIKAGLKGVLAAPVVRVSLVSRRPAQVIVVGEVRTPGTFELPEGSRVIEALARAGGLTEFAHRQRIYVVRRGDQPLRVRFRYAEVASGEVTSNRFVLLDGDVIVAE